MIHRNSDFGKQGSDYSRLAVMQTIIAVNVSHLAVKANIWTTPDAQRLGPLMISIEI